MRTGASLLHWERPSSLEDVLQPAGGIDWRPRPEYRLDRVKDRLDFVWGTKDSVPVGVAGGGYADEETRLLTISSNFHDSQ